METKTKVSLIYQKSSFAPIHSHYYAINWKKEPMVLSVDVLSLWPVLNVHHNICFFPFHFCQVICLIKSRHCKYLTRKSIHFEHLIEMLTPRWPLIERNFRALCSIICQWLKWFACNMWWSRVINSIFLLFSIGNLSTPKRIFHAEHAHTVATADAFIRQYFIEIN